MAEDLLTLKRQLQARGVTKEQLQAHLSGQKTQMPQAQGIQQPDISALMTQALGRSRPVPQEALFRGLSSLTSGKVVEDSGGDDYSKLFLQEAIKKQFEDPNYVVSYDQEGKPVFTQAPGNIKNQPFYATPQGGQYYQARTGQAEAQGQQAQAETGLMNQVMPAVQSAMQGNSGQLPPGASISAGPVTFQPNPRLTDTEQAAIAGSQALEPVVERIMQTVKGGIYGKGGDLLSNTKRTASQGVVDSGTPLLTSMNPALQSFQSDLNNLKRLIPFTDGGKQLTPFEAKRVFALLNTMGKSDEQIATDIQSAVSIVMAKGGLAIGGRNAALQGQQPSQPTQPAQTGGGVDFSTMSDEELQRIASGQ